MEKLISREQFIEYMNVLNIDSNEIVKNIEDILVLFFGEKYIHVLRTKKQHNQDELAFIVKQFDDLGLPIILLPHNVELDNVGTITPSSWSVNIKNKIAKLRKKLRSTNGN